MKKIKKETIILSVLLAGSIAYALYTCWPIVTPYLSPFNRPKIKVTTTVAMTSTTSTLTPLLPVTATKEDEASLVDPFALRIPVNQK